MQGICPNQKDILTWVLSCWENEKYKKQIYENRNYKIIKTKIYKKEIKTEHRKKRSSGKIFRNHKVISGL